MPKFSIITINLNNLAGLQKTMQSIFEQTFTDYEYIVIDGGSTDGSKEYIEEHADRLVYWVSEKDEGIYNAMNKGIEMAKGKYIHFLNSGDTYFSGNTLQSVFDENSDADILCGSVHNFIDDHQWEIVPPEKLTYLHLRERNLPHQGCFIKRILFEQIGSYNEGLQIASDWEFVLRAFAFYRASYKKINETVSIYPFNGISSLPENKLVLLKEKEVMLNQYFSFFEPDYLELLRIKGDWNKYNRSRAHKLLNRFMNSKIYKLFN